jgi:hypothetical protein
MTISGTGPSREPRMLSLSPAFTRLRIPTWPHVPRKFTRPSHLGFAIAPNRLFSRPGSGTRVGSIPIARSIFHCLACRCVVLGRGYDRSFDGMRRSVFRRVRSRWSNPSVIDPTAVFRERRLSGTTIWGSRALLNWHHRRRAHLGCCSRRNFRPR